LESNKQGICLISVGYQKEQDIYIKNKKKFSYYIRNNIIHYNFSNIYEKYKLKKIFFFLNNQFYINGIIVQKPIPIIYSLLINCINVNKDLECIYSKVYQFLYKPCTPLSCLYLLYEEKVKVEGQNIIITGKSNIVSIPLLHLLIKKKANIISIHCYSKNIIKLMNIGDIIITSIGCPQIINKKYINTQIIVIDIGINYQLDKSLVGDVCFYQMIKVVKKITSVPNGIGTLTIAMLFFNLYL